MPSCAHGACLSLSGQQDVAYDMHDVTPGSQCSRHAVQPLRRVPLSLLVAQVHVIVSILL